MTGEERTMTPHAFALALEESAAPLPVRAGWASFLRRYEPGPGLVREAVIAARLCGHMRAGRLTPDGVALALEALSGAPLPPLSIHGPHGGPGGEA